MKQSIKDLLKLLGSDYRIMNIDLEKCLYCDFGNGFNVEISGIGGVTSVKPLTIYLWFGEKRPECIIVKTIKNVERSAMAIHQTVEDLRIYSENLLSQGYNTRDKLFYLKFPELKPENLR